MSDLHTSSRTNDSENYGCDDATRDATTRAQAWQLATRLQRVAEAVARPLKGLPGFAAAYFAVATPFAVLLAVNTAWSLRFEDAFIVLRYARNVVAGSGFVFNPGERVLAVTTPLHTLLAVPIVAFAHDNAPAVQNVIGVAFLVLEGLLVGLLVRRLGHPLLALLPALLVLANLNFAYLYLGMETHMLVVLLLAAYLLWLDRRLGSTGLLLGLAFLTRYDAAVLAGLVGAATVLETRRFPMRLVAGFAVPVLPWLAFAALYFGGVFPTALAAKSGFISPPGYLEHVFWTYKAMFKTLIGLYLALEPVKAALSYLFPLGAALGAMAWVKVDRRHMVLALYPIVHLTLYASVGADPSFRWHYFVLNPLLLVGCVVGVAEVARWVVRSAGARVRRANGRWGLPAKLVLLVAALLPLLVHLGKASTYRYQDDPLTRQLFEIGEWLRDEFPRDATLLQPAIGILGWVTDMPIVDPAGLATPGLYYFDDLRCTPLNEILAHNSPDLVVIAEGTLRNQQGVRVLDAHGYLPVRSFPGPLLFHLYRRGVSSNPGDVLPGGQDPHG